MIRQTRTYLVSAMSGATLIAIAIAVFVVLVSAQVFRDWPIAALGGSGGEETAAVSKADPVGAPGAATTSFSAKPGSTGSATGPGGTAKPSSGSQSRSDSASPPASLGEDGQVTTEQASSGGGSGGRAGSGGGSETPASSPNPSSPGAGNGSSSGAGGSNGGGGSPSAGTTPSTSGQVTETVDNTVSKVDETALGGTLHETGVTEVTESVVNGVAGPESPVGHVVNETVGAVGGLLHGGN
jgi:hypothetical protein